MNYYYLDQSNIPQGPSSAEELVGLLSDGIVTLSTHVAVEGANEWSELEAILPSLISSGTVSQLPVPPLNKSQTNTSDKPVNVVSGIAETVSQVSGLEKLEGFSLSKLFSEAFKNHTPEEVEDHFGAGTVSSTPKLEDVDASWPTPWFFVRLLGISVLLTLGFYYALGRFENPNLIPGCIFVGSFGIPFSIVVFFMESNTRKNVSFYRVFFLMTIGGLISMIISLFLFEYTNLGSWIGAMSAGFVEELGKLLTVILIARSWVKHHWVCNGLLFGAAVGAGFAAFETSGYIFRAMMQDAFMGGNNAEMTMFIRASLAPFAHVIWTAATAGALWKVKGDKQFDISMLFNGQFLRVFFIVMGLHMLWNSPLSAKAWNEGLLIIVAFYLTLGFVGWVLILSLMQAGIKQVREAQLKT